MSSTNFENRSTMPSDAGVDLAEYMGIARKRWKLMAFIVFVFLMGASAFVFLKTQMYTAGTLILIERAAHNVIDIERVVTEIGNASDHGNFYNTQYELLEGRGLAEAVIQREALPIVPQIYSNRLEVVPIPDSRLVEINFSDPDAETAARVANSHAALFIERGRAMHAAATSDAAGFLDEQLLELEQKLRDSEVALAEFRRSHKLMSLDESNSLVVGRIEDLNTQLGLATQDRVRFQAQAEFIRENGAAAHPDIRSKESVVLLRDQLNELIALRDTGTRPTLGVGAKIADLERRMDEEIRAAANEIRASAKAAANLEKNLKEELAREKATARELKDVSVEYAILAREVDTNQKLYDAVLERKKELGMAAVLRESNIRVVDRALVPKEPSNPPASQVYAFAILFALLCAPAGAVAIEFFDTRIKKPEEIENLLGLPHLGSVPNFLHARTRRQQKLLAASGGAQKAVVPAGQPLGGALIRSQDPRVVMESYRAVRTNILLSRAGDPPRTLLVTSARKGEGKTVTSLNTAAMLRQMRARVLVVDGDLRAPSCRTVLGRKPAIGLTEVLAGHCEPEDAIQQLSEGFAFLDAGSETPPDPVELLSSSRMRQALEIFQKDFEYIVIDGAPLLPVSDSVALSPLVEGVVLVVDSETPKTLVARAHAKLRFARAKTIGVVLNRFDPKAAGDPYGYNYGYGDDD